MNRAEVFHYILSAQSFNPAREVGFAFAPTNIALCKYWGKRNTELNLPVTSSLSVSINGRGANARVMPIAESRDQIYINGDLLIHDKTRNELVEFMQLLSLERSRNYTLFLDFNIPVAAGLASSACCYAAIVRAFVHLYDWKLSDALLSVLARLGSGSACRSLWNGFVEWQVGVRDDGMDSHGVPLPEVWPELCLGLHIVSSAAKPISSRKAMLATVATSPLYREWPARVEQDMIALKKAIARQDFGLLGATAEENSRMMHRTMVDAEPSINYSLPETIEAMNKVKHLRQNGVSVYFTQDAGPNLKLLFLASDTDAVRASFPQLEIIAPFAVYGAEQIVLVDENDNAVGVGDKITVHKTAQLHRAFSIFILREKNGKYELLLQQRNPHKYHCGGLWSNTCCSHPHPNEDVISSARVRLQEEMNIEADLAIVGNFVYRAKFANGLTEHEYDYVLIGEVDHYAGEFNTDEVAGFRWVELAQLENDIYANPHNYTPWLLPALKIVRNVVDDASI